MSRTVMYEKDQIAEIIDMHGQVFENLNGVESSLNAIDASGLGLDLINIGKAKSIVNEDKVKIRTLIEQVMGILYELIRAEKDNIDLIFEILGDANIFNNLELMGFFEQLKGYDELSDEELKEIWGDVDEWTVRVVKIGDKIVKQKIPAIPPFFQNYNTNDNVKIGYGRGTVGTDGCGLISGIYYIRYLLHAETIPLETMVKIHKGYSGGGTDGTCYGGLDNTMAYVRN